MGTIAKSINVAAALIFCEGRLLAAKRKARPGTERYAGKWELPGGKIEAGEAADAACRRECLEELGITLGVLWPYDTIEYDYPEFHVTMDVFAGTISPEQPPKALEHEELRWLGRDELLSVDWLDSDLNLIRSVGVGWSDIFENMHL